MADRGIDVVRAHLAKLPPSDSLTVAERRAQYERAEKVFPTPPEVKVERVSAPVAPAEWLRPPGAVAGRVVLYLHGGGYVIGSPRSHRHLAAAIAAAGQASALLLDYRLAPEHPYPAAVDDATAAYRWLLEQGVAPGHVVIGGDSAGGGLT
ncbi:MAG TPA: alpha/beta hydrolase fold domain-containing protein, partial [Candidatus Eisenbacteria bacterium]|nr:alpha/beta hydrolase fold domain-containing protein [Candidatus Eisenbacteria bacterium]